MGWLDIKQTFNSNRMKKELKKQTKLMEKAMKTPPDRSAFEDGYYMGWRQCNEAWQAEGHTLNEGCRK